jgi:hypothetical protein
VDIVGTTDKVEEYYKKYQSEIMFNKKYALLNMKKKVQGKEVEEVTAPKEKQPEQTEIDPVVQKLDFEAGGKSPSNEEKIPSTKKEDPDTQKKK